MPPLDKLTLELLTDLFGQSVQMGQVLKGGNNNLIVEGKTADGARFVAKRYLSLRDDGQERLLTEFKALELLRRTGVSVVPEPLFCSRERSLGVYSYVDGRKLERREVRPEHIDQFVALAEQLAKIAGTAGPTDVGVASDGCTTLGAYPKQLLRRLEAFDRMSVETDLHRRTRNFVRTEVRPAVESALERFSRDCIGLALDTAPYPLTLSPSDFGFHNALLAVDNRIHFLDFEYFGWDDPAKMVADFLHHPAFPLSEESRHRFESKAIALFAMDATIVQRLATIQPLVALIWCLIVLKPFLRPARSVEQPLLRERLEVATTRLADTRFGEVRA